MLSQKTIRRKIKTVKNIQKITRAMKMVAAAKLRRVQERVTQSRPYAKKMVELVRTIAPNVGEVSHPLLDVREVRRRGLLVLTGDKGLCGGFNNNILRLAARTIEGWRPTPCQIMAVGKKGSDYFTRREHDVVQALPQPGVGASFGEFEKIADEVERWYRSGAVDEVHVVYAVFKSAMHQEPRVQRLLPVGVTSGERPAAATGPEYIFEPEASRLLGHLLPRYLRFQVYQVLLEAMASEQGARVTAMTAATDNANEMIESLSLAYNKARQWAITKELLDIVGGAEALKQVH